MGTELRGVQDARSGEAASAGFEGFFRTQFPIATRIAYAIVRDAQLAEDVAQEALIGAQRRFPDPDGSAHALAWVRVAASHLALNAVRDRRRRDERHRRGAQGDSAAGAEEEALAHSDGAEVRRALARLPRRSATVLVLRHSGLSYAEVAAASGIKVNQVGTTLRRAEAALRKEVERGSRS